MTKVEVGLIFDVAGPTSNNPDFDGLILTLET